MKPRAEFAASEESVAELARRIDRAPNVVIMCGAGCHGAAEELRALSDRLKAPLIHSVKGKDIMSYDDPHWMGGIGMIGTKAVYHAVMECDLVLMVGTDYPYSEFLPSKQVVVQMMSGSRCWDGAPRPYSEYSVRLGRPSECFWIGSRKSTIRASGTR